MISCSKFAPLAFSRGNLLQGHFNSYNPVLAGDADEVASRLLNLVPTSDTDPGADHYRQSASRALTVFVSTLKACKLR